MPGQPKPIIDPRFGDLTPIAYGLQASKQQAAALVAGSTQGILPDQFGNVIQLSGSNLNQIVTIGAGHGVPGVQVSTGIASGTAGLAVQSGPAITTITLTAGSNSATVGTVSGATLAVGQVIGAADVSDPSTGTPTPAITPGTTITGVSGSSVTLSQPAAEGGTGLYCAAARFFVQQDSGWEALTLPTGFTASAFGLVPAVRLIGDRVVLRGAISASGSLSNGTHVASVPSSLIPAGNAALIAMVLPSGTVGGFTLAFQTGTSLGYSAVAGGIYANTPVTGTSTICLDSASYTLA